MSMRDEVLKLAEECGARHLVSMVDRHGPRTGIRFNYDELERFYQAAYIAGAKAMQEAGITACNKSDRYRGYFFAELIKEIDLETLVNSTENL